MTFSFFLLPLQENSLLQLASPSLCPIIIAILAAQRFLYVFNMQTSTAPHNWKNNFFFTDTINTSFNSMIKFRTCACLPFFFVIVLLSVSRADAGVSATDYSLSIQPATVKNNLNTPQVETPCVFLRAPNANNSFCTKLTEDRATPFTENKCPNFSQQDCSNRLVDAMFTKFNGKGSLALILSAPLFSGMTVFSTNKNNRKLIDSLHRHICNSINKFTSATGNCGPFCQILSNKTDIDAKNALVQRTRR